MMDALFRERKFVGAVQSFLANYSVNFQLALLAWPFFSAFLTLPILAYVYHRDGKLKLPVVCGTYVSVLYLLGIICFAFYPLPTAETGPGITYGVAPQWNPLGFIGDIAKDGPRAVFQLLFNIVFFVPLGFIAGYLLRMRLSRATLLALGVSAFVEVAQLTGLFGLYDYAYRCCDVDDLVCNTLGGVIGWLCARALGSRTMSDRDCPEITRNPGFIRRCVAFWIDTSIIGFVAMISWIAVDLGVVLASGQQLQLFSLTEGETLVLWQTCVGALMFIVLEIVIPWFRGGSTLGGSFVRMTCETCERSTTYRVFFYVMRTVTMAMALMLSPVMFPVLGIYYLIKRCMPYDNVPAGTRATAAAPQ